MRPVPPTGRTVESPRRVFSGTSRANTSHSAGGRTSNLARTSQRRAVPRSCWRGATVAVRRPSRCVLPQTHGIRRAGHAAEHSGGSAVPSGKVLETAMYESYTGADITDTSDRSGPQCGEVSEDSVGATVRQHSRAAISPERSSRASANRKRPRSMPSVFHNVCVDIGSRPLPTHRVPVVRHSATSACRQRPFDEDRR